MTEMTDRAIDVKHLKLRGTIDLKYAGERQKRCEQLCGHLDLPPEARRDARHHQCFLVAGHKTVCDFSSECKEGRFYGL